jgi:hypothetical protein
VQILGELKELEAKPIRTGYESLGGIDADGLSAGGEESAHGIWPHWL